MNLEQIGILGGGLAGLTAAIHLASKGFSVTLFEKQSYPHHKVCGEYVSNEVLPYLKSLDVDVFSQDAKSIDTLQWTTLNARTTQIKLPLGGFGMSRYALDNILYKKAKALGVTVICDTVTTINFNAEVFRVEAQQQGQFTFQYVIGAFGKRSTLDKILNRTFIEKKTQWMAVKAHYHCDDFAENTVELHNFNGGYCGLSKVGTNAVNCCYLSTYESFQRHKDIDTFQKTVLSQNSHLKDFFNRSKLAFDKPLTIAQISFEDKPTIEQHILMIGDSAGLIHPLCGNGMAMAIHSAKLVAELLIKGIQQKKSRHEIEENYTNLWKQHFSKRLKTGAMLQKILLNPTASKLAINSVGKSPWLLKQIIKSTHGKPIDVC